jgi:hypothetical protein
MHVLDTSVRDAHVAHADPNAREKLRGVGSVLRSNTVPTVGSLIVVTTGDA